LRRIKTIIAAAVVLSPLLLVNAGSASAANGNGSMTVTTLGRNGKPVSSNLSVYNTKTQAFSQLSSGTAHSLPKGTYDVLVDIWNGTDDTDTVGAKVVTVSGTTKVTIDARQGRPVTASLSPAPGAGYQQTISVAACATGSPYGASGRNSAGKVYVIPSSNPAFELAYSSAWSNGSGAGANAFVVVGDHPKGLPSGESPTVKQSALATLKVFARSGPETGDSRLELSGDIGTPCMWGVEGQNFEDTLPYSLTAHVSPGQWSVLEQAQDTLYNGFQTYRAGKTYGMTVNAAVVGPSGDMPYVWAGQQPRLYLNTDEMFGDSALPASGAFSASYRLTKGGRTLLSKTVGGNNQVTLNPVLTSKGWYDLTVSAKRSPNNALPSNALSTASSLSFHFYTDLTQYQQIRGYLTRFSPAGLNFLNQVAPGSHTTVTLGLNRPTPNDDLVHQLSDSVKRVQAWYSTDGGRTWHSVAVKHSGSSWTTVVTAPVSGRVSLRSEVTGSAGDITTTTVDNAYAVS
jgi:hypothetical protein